MIIKFIEREEIQEKLKKKNWNNFFLIHSLLDNFTIQSFSELIIILTIYIIYITQLISLSRT